MICQCIFSFRFSFLARFEKREQTFFLNMNPMVFTYLKRMFVLFDVQVRSFLFFCCQGQWQFPLIFFFFKLNLSSESFSFFEMFYLSTVPKGSIISCWNIFITDALKVFPDNFIFCITAMLTLVDYFSH